MPASLLAALALAGASPDPLAASFRGWHVEIEDDNGPDSLARSVATTGCVTIITGEHGRWRVDWRTIEEIALADVFVFLKGPGLQIAVVADVRDAAGQAKLRGMRDGMMALSNRCRPRPN